MIDSTAIISIVAAAFFDSGGRNAGTPFETASTPVIAVQPLAKAVRSRKSVRVSRVDATGRATAADRLNRAGQRPARRRRRSARAWLTMKK